jgi:predicted RNA-binding Zn-ribbon protein involved in translation (DUF1610 family)
MMHVPVVRRAMAMIDRVKTRLARLMLGLFACPRCGSPGPHHLEDPDEPYWCVACGFCIDQDDALAALRDSSS